MTDPRTRSRAARVALMLAAAAAITGGAIGVRAWTADSPPAPAVVATTAPTAPAAPAPATTPVPPLPTSPVAPGVFPSTDCTPAVGAKSDDELGLGIPRPARLATPGPERTTFEAAVACLRAIGGKTPVLRTQLPIDATRRTTPGDDELAEVTAFGHLLAAYGAPGIVSVRAHDFTACPSSGPDRARQRALLGPLEPLQPCQYPSIPQYEDLFTELRDALRDAAPTAEISFTAWNEPDHPVFTLEPALGALGAARRAGEYWSVASGIAGAERVLAGEFSDRDLPTLLRLRRAFVKGTGGLDPAVWALHPYRELTSASGDGSVITGFEAAVAPAPVWLTEVTARLSGKGGIGGRPRAQLARGEALRAMLTQRPTRVVLYLLTPPAPPQTKAQDGWDSALADRQGRARPFVCGLAGLPLAACPGNPATFGG